MNKRFVYMVILLILELVGFLFLYHSVTAEFFNGVVVGMISMLIIKDVRDWILNHE